MGMQLGRIAKLLVGIFCAATATTSLWAADFPVKAPPLQPSPNWFPDTPMFGDLILVDTPVNIFRGAFKIAENESPRPTDRIYFNYNYFNNVDLGGGVRQDLYRATLGAEKTFLDGNASIGMRLPIVSVNNRDSDIGDISVIFKYAFINDTTTGNVLSAGLVVTAPTSSISFGFDTLRAQQIHSTILQPYVAGKLVFGDFFLQGFSSIALPTDSRDVSYLFNDIGLGYVAYRGGPNDLVRAISPMIEVHVNTPLTQGQIGVPLSLENTVNLTGGVQIDLKGGFNFGAAVVVPVAGPRPFDFETITRLSFRF